MRSIIIYSSRYGATEEYARWLGEATGIAVKKIKDFHSSEFRDFDRIIVGSGVRIGKLYASKWLQSHSRELQDKELVVFSVSASANQPSIEAEIEANSMPQSLYGRYSFYSLPGRIDPKRLPWFERLMLSAMAKMKARELEKRRKSGPKLVENFQDESEIRVDFDRVEKENLNEIIGLVSRLA